MVSGSDASSPGRPRDPNHEVAILDAVEQLLGRRGFDAMTMVQVAATAGVSKPTLYLRFASKLELVDAMIDRLRLPHPPPTSDGVGADLELLFRVQDDWIAEHGIRIVAAVLLEQDRHPELMERFQQRVVRPVRGMFRDVLRAGIERGELRPGADRAETIDALTGAAWARAWSNRELDSRWARSVISAVLTGLSAERSPAE